MKYLQLTWYFYAIIFYKIYNYYIDFKWNLILNEYISNFFIVDINTRRYLLSRESTELKLSSIPFLSQELLHSFQLCDYVKNILFLEY